VKSKKAKVKRQKKKIKAEARNRRKSVDFKNENLQQNKEVVSD
jgi:hypothetical protein